MGDHDDGTVALGHERTGRLVHGDDILAARNGPEVLEDVVAEVVENDDRDGADRKQAADEGKGQAADTGDEGADENDDEQERIGKSSERGRVELLGLHLDAMLAHELGDGGGCIELLLAVGRGDVNVVGQILKVIMRVRHDGSPST